jgi:hypothetical protein
MGHTLIQSTYCHRIYCIPIHAARVSIAHAAYANPEHPVLMGHMLIHSTYCSCGICWSRASSAHAAYANPEHPVLMGHMLIHSTYCSCGICWSRALTVRDSADLKNKSICPDGSYGLSLTSQLKRHITQQSNSTHAHSCSLHIHTSELKRPSGPKYVLLSGTLTAHGAYADLGYLVLMGHMLIQSTYYSRGICWSRAFTAHGTCANPE